MLDKGAVVALPYGVEGFATPKHLVKEDGSQAQLDEKLEFKVIEFNKDAKRIILSHSRIFEDVAKAEERAETLLSISFVNVWILLPSLLKLDAVSLSFSGDTLIVPVIINTLLYIYIINKFFCLQYLYSSVLFDHIL